MLRVWILCLAAAQVLGSPLRDDPPESALGYIINVPCPPGTQMDGWGRCRATWGLGTPHLECPPGQELQDDGLCWPMKPIEDCPGRDCPAMTTRQKRDVEAVDEDEDRKEATEQLARMEALQSEKRSKKRSSVQGKRERSKHAFLMMLKKKKMQMMKPKPPPPPPPPPHHHPPHHHPPHHEESEEEPEEEPAEEDTPAPERMFFADEACMEEENSTGKCPSDAEMVENGVESNDDFKEWKPEVSSESSESSESSSSSDSTGESGSVGGSGESEDEVLQKAIKIKLMKIFRMKQMYGPALRRWLVAQLKEYEDRWVEHPLGANQQRFNY